MKRIFLIIVMVGLFMNTGNRVLANSEQPDYEKYGRIAIAVVKEDYPGEAVVEYQYKGRQKVSESDVMDIFTFQVKENTKPVTVIVKIWHSPQIKKFLKMTVEEQKG
ncbi:DUF3889 domain-containing protein [Cytobacillus dafuensis]|uniref:DUF3889 domain-containing protein n=1 Tax=Cytobacillus dafuensis TaxID=1742359 RepID=A0A5B8Z237_CYTDA|nr:DUF3889 domain-containing protein [Cytobacillus dafuensis]QED47084.1 DUF3889 domain-containing protein [Cytobacillus dafuensis]